MIGLMKAAPILHQMTAEDEEEEQYECDFKTAKIWNEIATFVNQRPCKCATESTNHWTMVYLQQQNKSKPSQKKDDSNEKEQQRLDRHQDIHRPTQKTSQRPTAHSNFTTLAHDMNINDNG